MFDVPMNERAKRVTETVATLKAAFTGEPFEYRGPHRARHAGAVPTRRARHSPRRQQRTGRAASRPHRRRVHPVGARGVGVLPGRGPEARPSRPRPQPHRREPGGALAEDPEQGWEQMAPFFLHETNAYGVWQAQDDVASPYHTVADIDELRAPPASTACSPRSSSSRSNEPRRFPSRCSTRCAAGCRSSSRGRACGSSSTKCCRRSDSSRRRALVQRTPLNAPRPASRSR